MSQPLHRPAPERDWGAPDQAKHVRSSSDVAFEDATVGEDETGGSFLRQHAFAIGSGIVLAGGLIAGVMFIVNDDRPAPRPVHEIQIVNIIPPPPPPPPPPQEQQPEPEPEMMEAPEIAETDVQEEAPKEEPQEAPPDASDEPPLGPLGLDADAEGPGDSFNLAANKGGRGYGYGGGGGGGHRWSSYMSAVQKQIEEALRSNPKTRSIVARIEVRLWADGSGRIQRVVINPSTGDPGIDAALKGEVLPGLMLRQPPPDMPMPIVLRVTASRST